ncbi:MAG: TetR/AcrR family transcriptional regulator [Chloroflexi bacterium]|nr:MAG: TetR/AcrR family transcriptional regulator [Chloroflexota bacterium]
MARRPGLTEDVVVNAAIELVNTQGVEQLTVAALAQKLAVRPPSLYNHVRGLDGLRQAMVLRGLRALTAKMQTAVMGRAGFEALVSLAQAYRAFAAEQPGLYALTLRSNENADPEAQAAGQAAIDVVLAVLHGYGLEGDAALHATRVLRSALHGFVSLEMAGGFALPLSLDESFDQLLCTLDCGLRNGFGQNANPDSSPLQQ